jgi:hypothetical protein
MGFDFSEVREVPTILLSAINEGPPIPSVDIKHYYELMIERMEGGVPANWTGTYVATSK